jgi:serralysin
MATITYRTGIQPYQWTADWFGPNDTAVITTRSATSLIWTNADGTTTTLVGTGFTYDTGEPVLGTVSQIQVKQGATLLFTITGLSAELPSLYADAFGWDRGDGNRENGDGFQFLSNVYALGNNTINGSSVGDDILAGYSTGNDTINGNGGDDFIKGDPGNDIINGGINDYDTLTYEESHFPGRLATRGINVNMTTGVVLDCWGFTDTISGFEEVRGSRFADVFLGDANDNRFMGLRGADSFDGGSQSDLDTVAYYQDYRFGGSRGIVANWASGTVRDGWGSIDTIANIENIVGTKFNDRFSSVGAGVEAVMTGDGGIDVYHCGSGYDEINFLNTATQGAIVDMNRGLNEIINDGHGNTENYSVVGGALDALAGTNFDDVFTGDAADNLLFGRRGVDTLFGNDGADRLRGGHGADILSGGAGADTFAYEKTDEGGDIISGFSSIDMFRFESDGFVGLAVGVLAASAFQSRASDNYAQQSNDRFIYRQSDDTLWYDATGGNGTAAGAADAILIADITANATVSYTDIFTF